MKKTQQKRKVIKPVKLVELPEQLRVHNFIMDHRTAPTATDLENAVEVLRRQTDLIEQGKSGCDLLTAYGHLLKAAKIATPALKRGATLHPDVLKVWARKETLWPSMRSITTFDDDFEEVARKINLGQDSWISPFSDARFKKSIYTRQAANLIQWAQADYEVANLKQLPLSKLPPLSRKTFAQWKPDLLQLSKELFEQWEKTPNGQTQKSKLIERALSADSSKRDYTKPEGRGQYFWDKLKDIIPQLLK